MSDQTNNEQVINKINILMEELEKFADKEEPIEIIAPAVFDFILKRERIRRDTIAAGPRRDAVDDETVKTLRNAQLQDAKFVELEAIFRRLGHNPVDAAQYWKRLIIQKQKDLSAKQKIRAQKLRPRSLSPLSKLIDEIVLNNIKITENELLHELKRHDGIIEVDGELRDTINTDTLKIKNLKDRLHRAKKRNSR
jgi:hypothetical protein